MVISMLISLIQHYRQQYDNAEDEKNTNKQDNQDYKLKMRAILNVHP